MMGHPRCIDTMAKLALHLRGPVIARAEEEWTGAGAEGET